MLRKTQAIIIYLISAFFVIYSFCLNTAASVFVQRLQAEWQFSDLAVSFAIGSYIIGFALIQIPAGYLLDRYQIHKVLKSAIFLVVLGNLVIIFANNLLTFSSGNFLQGVGSAFAFTAAGLLIAEWFSKNLFPILMGLIETLSCLVAALLHYVLNIAAMAHAWREIYLVFVFFGLTLLIACFIWVKAPATHHLMHKSFKESLSKTFHYPQLWLCTLAAATSFAILLAYADLWYVKVQKFYQVEEMQSAMIGGLFYFAMGVATPLLGWISNLVKSRKLILHLSLVLGNMFLLLALYLPHFEIKTLVIIKIVSFFTGFLLSGSMLFYTLVKEAVPENIRGISLSIINTGVFLSNSVMLLLPYFFVTTKSINFFTYLWILPFFVMISILLLYFIKETYSEPVVL